MSIACHDLSMALLVLVSIVMLVVVALAFGVFALLAGDDPGLGPADADHALPLPGSRPLAEKDVSTLRFDSAMRGYRMDQVDRAIRRTAYDIGYKDEMIAVLEAEVTALREGRTGTMNVNLVDELVARFQKPDDLRGPIEYYREMVLTQLVPSRRAKLAAVYRTPITVPVTLVWGAKDGALSARVAMNSAIDAGCEVECRQLPGVGHFVGLEAADKLAEEIRRVLVGS